MNEKEFFRVTVSFWSHSPKGKTEHFHFMEEEPARAHVELTIVKHDPCAGKGSSKWKERSGRDFTSWRQGSGRPPQAVRMILMDVEAIKDIRLERMVFDG